MKTTKNNSSEVNSEEQMANRKYNLSPISYSLIAILIFGLGTLNCFAGRLVLNNNVYCVINKGAYLVIDTSSTSGIMTFGSGGNIISEADTNRVKWNIGTATGTYIIPFSYTDGSKIPFTFNVTAAGTGSGNLTASSYYTNVTASPNNRPLPTSVTNLNRAGVENDVYVVDRFWKIDVNSYTANPTANLVFTYRDAEWNTSGGSRNTITEASLTAQRWDGSTWQSPVGVDDATLNTVTVTGINTFSPWTLVDNVFPLPIELLYFTAQWSDETYSKALLEWRTASEINNDYFIIERSTDAIYFTPILKIYSHGNSSQRQDYSIFDMEPYRDNTSYYRLKQVDFDGKYTYSRIEALNISNNINLITIYPNPSRNNFEYMVASSANAEVSVRVVEAGGKIVITKTEAIDRGVTKKSLDVSTLSSGNYILQIMINNSELKNQKTEKQFLIR